MFITRMPSSAKPRSTSTDEIRSPCASGSAGAGKLLPATGSASVESTASPSAFAFIHASLLELEVNQGRKRLKSCRLQHREFSLATLRRTPAPNVSRQAAVKIDHCARSLGRNRGTAAPNRCHRPLNPESYGAEESASE